jgi:hypothetical protein
MKIALLDFLAAEFSEEKLSRPILMKQGIVHHSVQGAPEI